MAVVRESGNGGDMADNDVAAQAASARQYDWRPRPDPTVLTTEQSKALEQSLLRTISEKIAALRELVEQRLSGMDKATELVAERLDRINPELNRGRETLRTEFTAGDINLRELLEARIDAIDRATQLLAADVGKQPSEIDTKLTSQRELFMGQVALASAETARVHTVLLEKFERVDAQFVSNDKALTAALAAQEKAAAEQQKSNTLAIDKSEKTTSETIKANDAKTASSIEAQKIRVDDILVRVVRLEATGTGSRESRSDARDESAEERAIKALAQAQAAAASARTMSIIIAGVMTLALVVTIVVAFATHKP